jgi:hypothetical protein
VDANDLHRDADPLWYDRAEADVGPGGIIRACAYLFVGATAGIAAVRVYCRLPDRLLNVAGRRAARFGAPGRGRY